MRIDKFLSESKVSTRSETAKAVRRGEVLLNGVAVKRADTPVDPEKDVVTYCGEVVNYRRYTYVLLNKPEGYVSATEDKKEKTVLDLLPKEVAKFAKGDAGDSEFYVSDSPVNFDSVARIFLGGETVSAKKIDIEKF